MFTTFIDKLDELGAIVEVKEGILRFYDPTEKLIADVQRGESCLYKMRMTQGEPECNQVRIYEKSRL